MAKETYVHARKRGQSIVENAMLDDNAMTGMAKYLLIQFCSHRQGGWKINMKDIVQRSKTGRDAHYKALNELIHNKYVARIKVLDKGKFVEQIYVFGQIKEDVAEMMEEIVKEQKGEGFKVRIEFGKPHTESQEMVSEGSESSEKPLPDIPNTVCSDSENQYNINNQEQNTNKETINNKTSIIDDDKRTESSANHNEEDLNRVISCLRQATKEELSDRSFKSVLRKVMDKYNQGKIGNGKFRDYLVTSLANKIESLELRRIKEEAKSASSVDKVRNSQDIQEELSTFKPSGAVPFYNWLEESR